MADRCYIKLMMPWTTAAAAAAVQQPVEHRPQPVIPVPRLIVVDRKEKVYRMTS